ncbi:uncharacterized protein LOC129976539 isoform X2 [Argiope bruennichi]|uniref:uncharacterized protein LOC129976518 isoform X2 n=1 Tax=Argiope bruennichi TaxID=94029 RepID=UPI0024952B8E|nr:uncharacterized protein LOC129976518 isoform X2 [Argiope bruennichi]XP_055946139.1 uncharacterized protein LOC129976539 isoform X2 [Argiope bruennichi]
MHSETDNICLVRVSTIVGFLFLVSGLIMVVSSYIKNSSYDMEIALAFIVGTCLVFSIVLGYIFRFWWKMRTRRKEAPDEEFDTVGDYFRDIFCLPPNFRGERTEPEGSSEEVAPDIVTSC